MESRRMMNLVIFAYILATFSISTTTSDTFKIRSIFRTHLRTDCTLLSVGIDSNGKPSSYSTKGHCCKDKKYTDFEFNKYAGNNGLEATFQWSHDKSYYLTGHSTGTPFTLEKLSNGVTNNQRFFVQSTNSCAYCVRLQNVATNNYLASDDKGNVVSRTNPNLQSVVFQMHKCPLGIQVLCPFMDVSCTT